MKTIGLIGGLSWESTAEYYRIINETVRDRLGGLHSAKVVMVSLDFAEIEAMQVEGRWDDAGQALAQAARQLEAAGADIILICSNTMHKVADAVEAVVSVPLLHIADATESRIAMATMPMLHRREEANREPGIFRTCVGMDPRRTVGLLGTAFTMEQSFYRERIEHWGHTVLVPNAEDRKIVHRIIYEELCLGIVREESRQQYHRIMQGLVDQGADGIILGCTEIELLVDPDDDAIAPLLPTTRIHAEAAVEWAIADSS